jgi:hypothetical protein
MNTRFLRLSLCLTTIVATTSGAHCHRSHGGGNDLEFHQCEIVQMNNVWQTHSMGIDHNEPRTCPDPTPLMGNGRVTAGHALSAYQVHANYPDSLQQNLLRIRRPESQYEIIVAQVDQGWLCMTGETFCYSEQTVEFTADATPPNNYNYAETFAYIVGSSQTRTHAYMKYRVVWGHFY